MSLSVAVGLGLATPLQAQSEPSRLVRGAGSVAQESLLGNCPVQALRRAWQDGGALETAAVEREVLALCTERARQIRDWADELASGRAMLAGLSANAAPDVPETTPFVVAGGELTVLEEDIAELRARITRLESTPEHPETAAALAALRAELATAEAGLAAAQRDAGATTAPAPHTRIRTGTDQVPPDRAARVSPDGQDIAPPGSRAAEPDISAPRPGSNLGPTPAATAPDPAAAPQTAETAAPDPSASGPDPAPVPLTGAAPATAQPDRAPDSLPSDRPTQWHLMFAVRRGDGPWQVQLQGTREIPLSVPGAAPEAPPAIRWQVVRDPPVTLAVGDRLTDGRILEAVSAEGVALRDPLSPDAAPLHLPFADDPSPGSLNWIVTRLGEDGS